MVLPEHLAVLMSGLQYKTLALSDYGDDDELFAIFSLIARQQGFTIGAGIEAGVRSLIPQPHPPGFGNGRFMRNLLEESISIQAKRLVAVPGLTSEAIRILIPADLS